MEWKIGEIKQINGEWYQCVKGESEEKCTGCFFKSSPICIDLNCLGNERKDHTKVIFKKLEKVGETFTIEGILYQHYKVFDIDNVCGGDVFWCAHNYKAKTLTIEIKQNKEDMEENKLNLKLFDLRKAKEGKPVCTRDGRKARIICFDRKLFYRKVSYPILALVERSDGEDDVCVYNEKGKVLIEDGAEYKDDLMMLPEKKEGWVNIDKGGSGKIIISSPYSTKEEAIHNDNECTIDTIKINWSE